MGSQLLMHSLPLAVAGAYVFGFCYLVYLNVRGK